MKRTRTKRRLVPLLILLALLALVLPGFDARLTVARYAVDAGPGESVRLALITDLHSCAYGEGQKELLDAVDAEAPDIVVLVGDIFDDDRPDDDTETLLIGLAEKYPCYFVTGNHEYKRGTKRFSEAIAFLKEHGITRLRDNSVGVTINGRALRLCGVNDPAAWTTAERGPSEVLPIYEEYLAMSVSRAEAGEYTILLAHRPEYIDLYADLGFDLVLSGHTHGGQWRIPGLINGLFAPNQGFLPKYAGGKYQVDGTTLIVSRGLARKSTRIPRFYDRPELVIVDLT